MRAAGIAQYPLPMHSVWKSCGFGMQLPASRTGKTVFGPILKAGRQREKILAGRPAPKRSSGTNWHSRVPPLERESYVMQSIPYHWAMPCTCFRYDISAQYPFFSVPAPCQRANRFGAISPPEEALLQWRRLPQQADPY